MFGSHLSIAGALINALLEAQSLKLDTVQIFTKNQRQWRTPPLKDDARRDWLSELKRLGWEDRTVSHDSYLINLASPDDALWEKSIAMMCEELERCEQLSIPYLVSHPGAHTGSGADTGLERIAQAYARVFRQTRGGRVTLCLENTAGGGSTLGRTFEELARLADLIHHAAGADAKDRVGFCIDTCHALAAGYNLADAKSAAKVLDELDRVCGLDRVRVLHLNDSKGALGSHIDRHEHIGKGQIGLEGFSPFVNCRALADVPKIMETPKGKTPKGTAMDTLNLRRLRGLLGEDAKAARAKAST